MSATTEMFKSNHRFIPKLTHDNYPTWRKRVRRVLVAMRAYNIVTGEELLPEGNRSAARTLQMEWHQKANDAIALIHLGCTDNLPFPWIDDINDPVEMWQTLQGWLDSTTNQVGRTQIVRKFHDPTITTKTIPFNTTTAFQSKAITSHRERKKQSQTTMMSSHLTPASTIAARLCDRRLAHLHAWGDPISNQPTKWSQQKPQDCAIVAERMIHTITERANAMIMDFQTPLDFWGEAVNLAA